MNEIDKVVLVTKKTQLQELVARFTTVDQARFYLERSGTGFGEIETQEERFARALQTVTAAVPSGVRFQAIDREFLPNFVFSPRDLVVTLGPDGLVVNVAKYLDGQPIVAFNPDPSHIDGVLVPFLAGQAGMVLKAVLAGRERSRHLTMARITLNDGQQLHALNDFFIGAKTHVSARYQLSFGEIQEEHSSSGVIVSTGAGSTGWYRSLVTGAYGLASGEGDVGEEAYRWDPEAPELRFTVREPFVSRASSARVIHGSLGPGDRLELSSRMPQNGVIFGDGVEEDFLAFNAGAVATISVAEKRVRLVGSVG
jgi:NAD kinase